MNTKNFYRKLKRSGYSTRQCVEIIKSGISGHVRKVRSRVRNHRRGEETEGARRVKKLTGRTSWYKMKQKKIKSQRERTDRRRQTDSGERGGGA